MAKYRVIIIIACTAGSVYGQAAELGFVDQDLMTLADQVTKLNLERYKLVREKLEQAAQHFHEVLKLHSEQATEDNPFKGLAKEFKNPYPDKLTLRAYAQQIADQLHEIGLLLKEEKHSNAIQYLEKIVEIFDTLKESQLWPSQKEFQDNIKSVFREITRSLSNTIEQLSPIELS